MGAWSTEPFTVQPFLLCNFSILLLSMYELYTNLLNAIVRAKCEKNFRTFLKVKFKPDSTGQESWPTKKKTHTFNEKTRFRDSNGVVSRCRVNHMST